MTKSVTVNEKPEICQLPPKSKVIVVGSDNLVEILSEGLLIDWLFVFELWLEDSKFLFCIGSKWTIVLACNDTVAQPKIKYKLMLFISVQMVEKQPCSTKNTLISILYFALLIYLFLGSNKEFVNVTKFQSHPGILYIL